MKKFVNFTHLGNLIFFSNKGESMSDANSMKGKCTQIAEDVKAHINALGAVKETIHFDGKNVNTLNPFVSKPEEIKLLIGKDSEANALNAWYSNAITQKRSLLDSIRKANWTLLLSGEESYTPEIYDVKFDTEEPRLKQFAEDDVLSSWSANDIADYFIKEQYCASVGKLIHRKGKLHDLYNSPINETSKFIDLKLGDGVKSYPVVIQPVYEGASLTAIKNLYLKTHDEHREVEKQLNFYKAKVKNELSEVNAAAQTKYSEEMSIYGDAKAKFMDEKSKFIDKARNANIKLKAKCESRREKLLQEASELKIFIPENFRAIKKLVKNYKSL